MRRIANVGPSSRSLSVGIIVVGLGLALMTIISIAGESPEAGIGVGGAIAILGGAFIVRSIIVRPDVTPSQPRTGQAALLPGRAVCRPELPFLPTVNRIRHSRLD